MPAHISHAIMGEEIYHSINNDFKLLKTSILKQELQGYSLGIDLSVFSQRIKANPHHELTKEFLIHIIKYIKEQQLQEYGPAITFLYGHIAHYCLDTFTHPLIYYLDKGTKRASLIPNHNLIEGYINSYLTQKILNKDIMDMNSNYFNQINLSDPEIAKLVNEVYGKIYNDYHMIDTYRKTINIFTKIENVLKISKLTKKQLIKLSRFDKYLDKNNLSLLELTNDKQLIYTNPITGIPSNETFIELYKKAIDRTIETINLVNKYLYDSQPIEILNSVFDEISYNTGVKSSYGTNMKYVRKMKNNKTQR